MTLACVLISDITGSTQLYERESNETALERIAPVLDRMRELVSDAGGHCVKSKGDDTISVFVKPDEAFDAAWAMINEDWHHGMNVHAGLYFGEVLREEEGLYGGVVNTAARLASLAKPGEMLVGDAAFDELDTGKQSRMIPVGDLHLRGKDATTRVYSAAVSKLSAQTVVFAKKSERPRRTEAVELTFQDRTWRIGEGETLSIGRSRDCDIVVDQAWVSRRHGEFSIRQWQLEYKDHSSVGSVLRTGDGKQLSIHRRTTMLSGSGTILLGGADAEAAGTLVDYVSHDMSIEPTGA